MDVVRREIDELRGSIDIASTPGQGTTITLALPLTLAIIDGLLVRVDANHYVLPLAQVEECVELSAGDVARAHGRDVVNVRGRLIPCIRLRDLFGIPGERPAIEQVAIISTAGECTGFVVDEVLGGRQTVIKSLGRMYRDAEGFSGATILGNGDVALIIDVPKIVQVAERAAQQQWMRE
jgi:two-component system chemotaxis sensor kinase CheA